MESVGPRLEMVAFFKRSIIYFSMARVSRGSGESSSGGGGGGFHVFKSDGFGRGVDNLPADDAETNRKKKFFHKNLPSVNK